MKYETGPLNCQNPKCPWSKYDAKATDCCSLACVGEMEAAEELANLLDSKVTIEDDIDKGSNTPEQTQVLKRSLAIVEKELQKLGGSRKDECSDD